jgi:tripartite-type tricarboxylate transporter receptor subunit TctC
MPPLPHAIWKLAAQASNVGAKDMEAFMTRCFIGLIAALAALLGLPAASLAQDYPNRTVKIIVPYPAGGTADAMPRIVADFLSRKWGQGVIIENKSGAGGNVGAEAAYHSDPDGYTLFASPPPALVINQNLYPKLPFDPTKFIPLAVMGKVPNSLLTNSPKLKDAKTVADVITYAKAHPGDLNSATQGVGTTAHLTSELFQMMAKVKFQNVHYRGSAPAIRDLVGGIADIAFDNIGASMSLIQGGKIRILGVASEKRVPSIPQVPTISETVPGFVVVTWFALVAPPKTPQPIVDKLHGDINEALRDSGVREKLEKLSADVTTGSLKDTAAFFESETKLWAKVIKDANVKLP